MLPVELPTAAALAAIVAVALATEAVTGFGATIIAMTIASWFLPIAQLLPAYVPVNMLMSAWFVLRDPAGVDRRWLFGRILPAAAVGFPLGALGFRLLGQRTGALEAAFGAFVVVVALHRLAVGLGVLRARQTGHGAAASIALLVTGGVVHGLVGTGGPLVVLALSNQGLDKRAFRQTLSAVWLGLSVLLLSSFAAQGALGRESLALGLVMLPGLPVGLLVGQAIHHRLDADRFRRAVDGLLVVAGAILVVRTLWR